MQTTSINIATDLLQRYRSVRKYSEMLCEPLSTEDYVVQPTADVSPPKWHLGHTTWFFEHFVLSGLEDYQIFHPDFAFMFNSYYEAAGARVLRPERGNMSRPTVSEVYQYRKYVDDKMARFLSDAELSEEQERVIETGLHHEQQHQELLLTDIKYILGHNPLFPVYGERKEGSIEVADEFIKMQAGLYSIGHDNNSFSFDNELGSHKVYLNQYQIRSKLVTNEEYLEFIKDGGYRKFNYWHSDGWAWASENNIKAPLYWHCINGRWHHYTLNGLQELNLNLPVAHISFYEAAAFAEWKGFRLPTEFEWEAAAVSFHWGQRWEWTNSAYLPYPGFKKADGALGEYNGKFMVNQMVLRGASVATPPGHARVTYRNFFHPHLRWQYTGIRLAK